MSCRKSTVEKDVSNFLKGVSAGTGRGRFQTGKSGEERSDMGMAGDEAGKEGEVSRLKRGRDGVGDLNSGSRWKETGATDLGRGRDLALDVRLSSTQQLVFILFYCMYMLYMIPLWVYGIS